MRIGIVLHPFGNASKGLEQHIFDGTCAIISESHDDVEFIVFVKGNPDTSGLPPKATVINLPDTPIWKLPLFSWRNNIDLFIFYTESAPFFLWKKSIVVFFDAAYYYFGSTGVIARIHKWLILSWRRAMLSRARHIVTHADTSKKDLVEKFFIDENHVSVIYPGFKPYVQKDKKGELPEPAKPFFLYVGPMKERKNVTAIVEAFILFRQSTGLSHELYLVGRKKQSAYADNISRIAETSPYSSSILFKTTVTDDELQDLYRTATALVFPSLLEGFGFPVLEALSARCMVITSGTTSTKEVLGPAGMLVDPTNVSEIAATMARVAHGEYDREVFLQDASAQCAKFSWEKSGQGWNALLRNLLFKK